MDREIGVTVPAGAQLPGASIGDRDRVADALRAGSLAVVMVGHWLMADVSPGGRVGNALTSAVALQPLTWVLQVMPLFFLVGGVAHGYALQSARRRGLTGTGGYGAFVGTRAQRLLRRTLVLIAVWVMVGLLVRAVGADGGAEGPLIVTGLRLVTQPLWFVGIYLGVAVLAPAMFAAHRRWRGWVVAVLVGAAVTVDLLRFAGIRRRSTSTRIFDPNDPAYHWQEPVARVSIMGESAVGADRVDQGGGC
jgi:hypothetical protein